MSRTLRSLRARARWIWQQESAWADVTVAGALLLWSLIDLTAGPGVTDRAAFAMYAWIPDELISLFTVLVTAMQISALLLRSLPGRIVANFLQGGFWGVVTLTLMFDASRASPLPLLLSCSIMMTLISWAGLARVTRRYSSSG